MLARIKAGLQVIRNFFTNRERNVLTGLSLTISGLFLPWINVISYSYYNQTINTTVEGTVIGYSTPIGKATLTIAIIYAFTLFFNLSFIKKELLLRKFLTATASLLFVAAMLGTTYEHLQRPSLSVVVSLAGLVLWNRATFQER